MSRARDTADQINRINSSAADATAITVDSSENVLIGRTSSSGFTTSSGSAHFPNGSIFATVDGGQALNLSRLTSDGSIAGFYKDGTTVGTIGSAASGGQIYVSGTDTGLAMDSGSDLIFPCNASGAERDNAINLGYSGGRFKDAYIGGGVYLGGTGSANKLDDFETGSFTPTFTSSGTAPSLTYTTQGGIYVKVGNLVTIWIKLRINNISSAGSGNLRVAGLPFTVTDACAETGGSVGLWLSMASASGTEIVQQRSGGNQLFVLQNTTNSSHSVNAMANGGYLRCTTSYTTA